MMKDSNFTYKSYVKHENHYLSYSGDGLNAQQGKSWLDEDTIDAWRHERMYKSIDPLLSAYPQAFWLTVGDGRFGNDAHYIHKKGIKVLATDISEVLLKEAKRIGYIGEYKKENAECLSFCDGEFDFVLCKESYHHFPRPMIALYEMLRVSKSAVVLIEPNDPLVDPTLLETAFARFKDFVKLLLGKRAPRHSFEEIGNYVYGISRREIEKVALGMGFNMIAFKGINDWYVNGVELEKVSNKSLLFRKIRRYISLLDFLARLKLMKHFCLVAVIFKRGIEPGLKDELATAGYDVINLPNSPGFQEEPPMRSETNEHTQR